VNIRHAVSISDLKRLAKRKLPSFIFDMIEGGVEDEFGVARNRDALKRHALLPRMLADINERDQSTSLFGRDYASPFGISPTGPGPIYHRQADVILADVAKANDIPFILSGTSGASLERIAARSSEKHAWYQVYAAKDHAITADVVRRAQDAGYETLVATVDTPVTPKRERHLRNRITTPLRLTPHMIRKMGREAFLHPSWMLQYLRLGMPMLENWQPYVRVGASSDEVAAFFRSQSPSCQTWRDMEMLRRGWSGKLVIKGILHPNDAVQATELGIDGLIVSNHGGKVLDRAPAPIEMLPRIKDAVGDRATVMMDGGIRRGSDVVVARALGAQFVFVGRATLYGVAAAGQEGAERAVAILREEIDLILGTIGCRSFDQITSDVLS
jgi:(S)-mandelate dehydrogenase